MRSGTLPLPGPSRRASLRFEAWPPPRSSRHLRLGSRRGHAQSAGPSSVRAPLPGLPRAAPSSRSLTNRRAGRGVGAAEAWGGVRAGLSLTAERFPRGGTPGPCGGSGSIVVIRPTYAAPRWPRSHPLQPCPSPPDRASEYSRHSSLFPFSSSKPLAPRSERPGPRSTVGRGAALRGQALAGWSLPHTSHALPSAQH